MADDHQYYLRQRVTDQPPIPSGLSTDIVVTTVTTSSSQLTLPPQLSQPRQLVEQPEQIPVPTFKYKLQYDVLIRVIMLLIILCTFILAHHYNFCMAV